MSNSNQDHQDLAGAADQADAIVNEDFEINDLENQQAA